MNVHETNEKWETETKVDKNYRIQTKTVVTQELFILWVMLVLGHVRSSAFSRISKAFPQNQHHFKT